MLDSTKWHRSTNWISNGHCCARNVLPGPTRVSHMVLPLFMRLYGSRPAFAEPTSAELLCACVIFFVSFYEIETSRHLFEFSKFSLYQSIPHLHAFFCCFKVEMNDYIAGSVCDN